SHKQTYRALLEREASLQAEPIRHVAHSAGLTRMYGVWWHISRQRGRIRAARADGDAHGCLRSSPTHMGRGMPDAAVARRGSSPECQTQQSGMPGVAGALPDALPDALRDTVSDALPYTLQGDGAIPYRSKPGGRSVFTIASRRVAFRRSAGRFTSPQVDG
ncbi:hypothetical protein T492DRAFT_1054119, partial [Pavlovales sp. CCMP2436]